MKRKIKSERKKLLRSVERILDGPMIVLGFVWLVLLVIELVWGINKMLKYLIIGIWIIFIIDFLIMFFLVPEKNSFLKKHWLTAISLFIPALRVFRIIRFVRLLRGHGGIRIVRIIMSINRSMRSLGNQKKGVRLLKIEAV